MASRTDFLVRRVLDEVRPMLTPDNGDVQLVSIDDGVVRVRYDGGHNEKCFECVMPPDDFRMYLMDLFRDRVPDVRDVQVNA